PPTCWRSRATAASPGSRATTRTTRPGGRRPWAPTPTSRTASATRSSRTTETVRAPSALHADCAVPHASCATVTQIRTIVLEKSSYFADLQNGLATAIGFAGHMSVQEAERLSEGAVGGAPQSDRFSRLLFGAAALLVATLVAAVSLTGPLSWAVGLVYIGYD